MSKSTHVMRVAEARRVRHPALATIEKHYFTVNAADVPLGIPSDPNAREATGINRQVYKDVRASLLGQNSLPGTFDLLNKGITILASEVRRISDDTFEVVLDEGEGIVDGGHTYRIITDNQSDPNLPAEQFVEIQVRTGVKGELITEIARGLNTGIQVRLHSLANLDGAFDWIKNEIRNEAYASKISWREGDDAEYDVRDLLSVLEALNIFDFPNSEPKHPVHAYEKWSVVVNKLNKEYAEHRDDVTTTTYYRLRPILRGGLELYDRIRKDFRHVRNDQGGKGGRFKIVEEARKGRLFDFPFAGLEPDQYRLTKGATMPILASFRNAVGVDPKSGDANWNGGFPAALELWDRYKAELVSETANATQEIGNLPDQLGKSRQHWANLHKTVALRALQQQMSMTGKR